MVSNTVIGFKAIEAIFVFVFLFFLFSIKDDNIQMLNNLVDKKYIFLKRLNLPNPYLLY